MTLIMSDKEESSGLLETSPALKATIQQVEESKASPGQPILMENQELSTMANIDTKLPSNIKEIISKDGDTCR